MFKLVIKEKVLIVHFSCGAASAVSALICLMEKPEKIELVYTDPGLEHKDNQRFLRDFEKLVGQKVTILKSEKYNSPMDVFEDKRFLSMPNVGAPCTTELKKKTSQKYLGVRLLEEVSIFGYDPKERHRAKRFKENNPELKSRFPLIEQSISKNDCYYILDALGLDLPYMYKLGYRNANCTGCVKATSMGYWAAIREDFPDIYEWYAKFERKIGKKDDNGKPAGMALNKKYIPCPYCKDKSCDKCNDDGKFRQRVFLDELPKDQKPTRNISFTCGYSCGAQDMEIEAVKELTKEPSLIGYMMASDIKDYLTKEKTCRK
jgi:3'-phosphoadenosine 5'-phosphosulfate sulfotransferase (PAPS reductase)/FAD synthetase